MPGVIAAAHRIRCAPILLVLIAGDRLASAADALPFAAPAVQSATTPVIGTLRVAVAMMVVLAAVLAAAWLTRRLRGASGGSATGLEVVAQVSLGTRERAVLLKVGDRQLLLGVAPGNVRTLHVLDSINGAATPEPSNATAPGFKSLLMKSLGQ
jgi:flagellar protein FliO/FliZ